MTGPVEGRVAGLADSATPGQRHCARRAVQPPVTCLAISMSRSQAGDDTPTGAGDQRAMAGFRAGFAAPSELPCQLARATVARGQPWTYWRG